jgi:predicted RNA-binding Zn-ribbon protein involved in translation (DUF1610 family)
MEIIPYLSDWLVLAAVAALVFAITVMPAVFRWARTVRCPKCGKWFNLDYRAFNVRDKVVGHSSTSFGGGIGGLFGRLRAFIFGHATRTNADPFIREWGTAHFACTNCGCSIELDTRRDRK